MGHKKIRHRRSRGLVRNFHRARADTQRMPLFQITRITPSHRKTLDYVPAVDETAALAEWGRRGCTDGDRLEAERVYGFSDGEEGTETMR